jgi:hypothetical protein
VNEQGATKQHAYLPFAEAIGLAAGRGSPTGSNRAQNNTVNLREIAPDRPMTGFSEDSNHHPVVNADQDHLQNERSL